MRSVIQRCNWCRVLSEGKVCGEIGKGLVALLGIKLSLIHISEPTRPY